MFFRKRLFAVIIASIAATGVSGCASPGGTTSAASDGDALTMAIPADVFDLAPIHVGIEEGVFEQAGVLVETEIIHTGVDATKALLGKKMDLAMTGGAAVLQGVAAGNALKLVAPIVQTSPYVLAAHQDLPDIQALKGKSIAVSELGSSSDLAARQALAANDIAAEDVDIRSLGGNSERMAAVAAGAADAVLLSNERQRAAEDMGLHVMADFTEQRIETLNLAIAARDDQLEADPELAGALVRAVRKSLEFYVDRANKEVVLEDTAEYLELDVTDPVVEDTYAYFVDNVENPLIFPSDGKFLHSVIEKDIAASSENNDDVSKLTPEDVVAADSLGD